MVALDKEVLEEKRQEILELEEIIDANSGGSSAGKRAIANSFARDTESVWKPLGDKYVEDLKDKDIRAITGFVTGLVNHLNSAFRKDIDSFLEQQVEETSPDDDELLTEEELSKVYDKHSDLRKKFENLLVVAQQLGVDGIEGMEVPQAKRKPATGKRGPRMPYKYDVSVQSPDGEKEALTGNLNNINGVAKLYGAAQGSDEPWTSADIKEYMETNGFDFNKETNDGSPFQFTLPSEHVVFITPKAEEREEEQEVAA